MFSWFLSIFSSPVLSFVSKVIGSLTSEQVAIVQAKSGLALGEAQAVVQAEMARVAAQSQVQMAQMTHPIWWVAWTLFVIPVGLYDAAIHLKSLGCALAEDAKTCNAAWNILEVPKGIEAWDMYVILSMFGLAVTSSVVTNIVTRLGQVPK